MDEEIRKALVDSETKLINITAGPGSGKSTLIAEMVDQYASYYYGKYDNIICLTFTNEAYRELYRKIVKLNGSKKRLSGLTITTFHKFAAKLTNKEKEFKDLECNCEEINLFQRAMALKNGEVLTVDDIIQNAINALNEYKDNKETDRINRELLENMKILFIDEAQDLGSDTADLISKLIVAREDLKVITVSDPNQGIFAFAGSKEDYLAKLMSGAKEFYLPYNYRSTQTLVDFTENYVFNALPGSPRKEDKKMTSGASSDPDDSSIELIDSDPGSYQYAMIDSVIKLIEDQNYNPRQNRYEIGVILPRNDDVDLVFRILNAEYADDDNVIVETTGSRQTFSLDRLDEFHSLFRNLEIAFARTTDRDGQGHKCLYTQQFIHTVYEHVRVMDKNDYYVKQCTEQLTEAYKSSPYAEHAVNILLDFIRDNHGSDIHNNRLFCDYQYEAFKQYVSSFTFEEFYYNYIKSPADTDHPAVTIEVTTIHKAKGKEYDHVFMACFKNEEEWLNQKDPYALQKCRYVAMTRARSRLSVFKGKDDDYYSDIKPLDMTGHEIKDYSSIGPEIILSPKDLALSFMQPVFHYSQFIPNENPVIDGVESPIFFPDTEHYHVGQTLRLSNDTKESSLRLLFETEQGETIERLGRLTDKNNLTSGLLDILCQRNPKIKELLDNKSYHFRDKEITKLINDMIDIKIGAFVIIDGVDAPWNGNSKYFAPFLQAGSAYDYEGKLTWAFTSSICDCRYIDIHDINKPENRTPKEDSEGHYIMVYRKKLMIPIITFKK